MASNSSPPGMCAAEAPPGSLGDRVAGRIGQAKDACMQAPNLTALLFLTFLAVVFFSRALITADVAVGLDAAEAFYPWWQFTRDSLRAGLAPLWNPYQSSGTPLVANPQAGVLYPLNWPLLLLPPARALNVSVALHVLLAGLFTYLYARHLKLGAWPSSVAAVTFMFSGSFVGRIFAGHVTFIQTICWMPLLFLTFERALERRRLGLVLAAGGVFGLSLLAGFPQMSLISLEGLAVILCFRLVGHRHMRRGLTSITSLAAVVGVGLLLAAMQILPSWELTQRSIRAQPLAWEFAKLHSLLPYELVTLVWPELFGNHVDHFRWVPGIWHESCWYVGVLPLLLALTAVRQSISDRRVKLLVVLLGLSLALALGPFFPAYRIVHELVPFFGQFRAPARHLVLTVFSLSVLAGLGAQKLNSVLTRRFLGRALLLFGLASAVCYALARSLPKGALTAALVGLLDLPGGELLLSLRPLSAWQAYVFQTLETVLAAPLLPAVNLAVAGCLLLLGRSRQGHRYVRPLVMLIIVLDLWSFGLRFTFRPVRPDQLVQRRFIPDSVAASCPNLSRVASIRQGTLAPRNTWWFYGPEGWNYGAACGQYSIHGYDPMFIRSYAELFTSIDSEPLPNGPDALARSVDDYESPILRLLSVGCVVTDSPIVHPEYRLLQAGETAVYQKLDALPRAWLVHRARVVSHPRQALSLLHSKAFDPAQEVVLEHAPEEFSAEPLAGHSEADVVSIEEYQPNRIDLTVSLQSHGYLVLSEVFYPGWTAFVDSKPVPIVRANYTLRAISLSPGNHRVVVLYRPATLYLGLAISLVTATVVALVCLGARLGYIGRASRTPVDDTH